MKNLLLVSTFIFLTGTLFGQTATPPSVGNGSSGNPYEIATLNNLYWITQNSSSWSSYFIQTADIDAASTSSWASGTGFTPIGNGTIAFTGSYDGQTYKITGLYVNHSTQYNGLFGFVSGGTLKNVKLEQAQVTGGDNYAGGLVGYLYYSSTATNCSSTGSVSGTFYVGGLIGAQDANSATSSCYSSGSTTGSGGAIGGLMGVSSRTSTIKNSYSTDTVTGTNSAFNIGGLIGGENSCTDTNCYSTGPVTGTNSSSNVGGLIGMQISCTVTNCFWDTMSSDQGTSASGIGKSTADMKTQSTFTNAGWNFTTVWSINSSINNGYPCLASNSPTFVEGAPVGTPETFSLSQNYPNPFNPTTTIQFSVEKDGRAIVKAFDLLGREVTTLYENVAQAGKIYTVTFNGSRFSSGVYFYSIESSTQRMVKKMMMLK
jgi:Secretion system C-terminal sorting domain/The GLUG motif